MVEYGFVEGLDFKLPQMGELENAGLQTKIDYSLSLDIANVLAMVEKSDQGRVALLARTDQTRPDTGVLPLPADRVPFLLAVLVRLVFFGGFAFPVMGRKKALLPLCTAAGAGQTGQRQGWPRLAVIFSVRVALLFPLCVAGGYLPD
jgi:hypothetical protein